MFVNCFLFACFMGSIFALERGVFEKYGPFRALVNSRIMSCTHNRNLNMDVSDIRVHFYDFNNGFNQSFPIGNAANEILNITGLDKTRKFIMFVGGFTSHIEHSVEKQVREAYKNHHDSYLIIPDHSAYTYEDGLGIKSYKRSVLYVHYIGKALGQMLADLRIGGVSPKNFHSVGHSLGGQILGHVGSTFYNVIGEKIARITALDPAGPGFTNSEIENQVRSGVADYVEVYHCNAGALGSSSILGDANFIMNKNGEMNPHCKAPVVPTLSASSKAASCNHRICVDVWTASLKHKRLFSAFKCDSYDSFKNNKCESDGKTVAGSDNPGATGTYYFSTDMHDLNTLA